MTAPFSPAADRNKQLILDKLQEVIGERKAVLEIGSGTAQHVVYFSKALPSVIWQPSNLPEILEQTQQGLANHAMENINEPIALDVSESNWPMLNFDLVYTANTCHIMPWDSVVSMFSGVANLLASNGLFCVYGPFNYLGQFTSESNREFDAKLRASKVWQGIRDFEAIEQLANQNGLELQTDFSMPANNHFLIFKKAN